jgi:hypothetical protein
MHAREVIQPHQLFDEIMHHLSFEYRGYAIHKILDSVLRDIVFRNAQTSNSRIIKNFFQAYNFKRFPKISAGVLSTFVEFTSRKDYLEIWQYVLSRIRNVTAFKLASLPRKPWLNLAHIRLGLQRAANIKGLSRNQRLHIASLLANTLNNIDSAEAGIETLAEKYVSFCSVMCLENLLTQYFNKRNVPTYDLQHGATRIYEKNFIDAVEYSNIVAGYHLTWGEYSRDELIRYGLDEKNIIAAGYPREKTRRSLRQPQQKNCIVFLSRRDFDKENEQVIQILAHFNATHQNSFSFSFKLHPSLNRRKYSQLLQEVHAQAGFRLLGNQVTLQDVLNSSNTDFCITVNTSCYFECYMWGIPTLRFYSEQFDLEYPIADDLFSTREEFSTLVYELYHHFDTSFNNEAIQQKLDYALGLDRDRYAEVLNEPANHLHGGITG